jgi:hypothetical protein
VTDTQVATPDNVYAVSEDLDFRVRSRMIVSYAIPTDATDTFLLGYDDDPVRVYPETVVTVGVYLTWAATDPEDGSVWSLLAADYVHVTPPWAAMPRTALRLPKRVPP